ncbi:NlpC/P60 family protein [uncultured Psychromonas sp.]|uniref:C40 family peptidase n=1 Tax=uncultured Psychromonas sp. TaxID=173974 RepID=UPI0026268FCC|nr:NlpC/P60 family protein [uncultured Psychromonas sp.]
MASVIKIYFRHISLLTVVLLLAACSSAPKQADINMVTNTGNKTLSASESKDAKGHHSDSAKSSEPEMEPEDLLYVLLRSEYAYWVGSPYKYGGNTLNGIDCSSLVQQVFENSFNIDLPRTTEYQVKKGISIKKSELEVGDLVFFKTGRRTRHVGIYMGDDEFFHVSTSQGTKISSLSNVYWKKHYWQSRRIID